MRRIIFAVFLGNWDLKFATENLILLERRKPLEKTINDIIVEFMYPPIPIRQFDYCAYFRGDSEEGPIGFGETKEDAIIALKDQMEGQE